MAGTGRTAPSAPRTDRVSPLQWLRNEIRQLGSEDHLERPPRELRAGFIAVLLPWFMSRALVATTFLVTAADTGKPSGFAAFKIWDVNWYTLIAEQGYSATGGLSGQTAWPFFPLTPAILRAGDAVGLEPAVTATLAGNAAFLLGLWGVYVIARRHSNGHAAALGVWVLALFPASAIFSTGYPDGFLLASSVWAFVLVEDKRDGWASVLAVVAVLSRPNGFVAVLALALAARSLRRVVVLALPAFVAFCGWVLVVWILSGDPLSFMTAKAAWQETTILLYLRHPGALLKFNNITVDTVLLGIALLVLFLCRKRLPVAWLAFAALWVLPAIGLGIVGSGRYVNECFPVSISLGETMERWPRALAVATLGGSAVMLVIVSHNLQQAWVP